MPIHDWNQVNAGVFHDFHNAWIQSIKNALNQKLPHDYYALSEQAAGGFIPDVLTLHHPDNGSPTNGHASPQRNTNSGAGVALATTPPKVTYRKKSENEIYLGKTKTVTVRHSSDHQVVAIVEIVSQGNKRSAIELARFVKKSAEFIEQGIHLLAIDLFPPTSRDPNGIHGEIWNQLTGDLFSLPADLPLSLVSYRSDVIPESFVEPTTVGQQLIDMPLFYDIEHYISVPLETTYMLAWETVPEFWKREISA